MSSLADALREAVLAESYAGVPVFGPDVLGSPPAAALAGVRGLPRWVQVQGVRQGRTPAWPGPVVDITGHVAVPGGHEAVAREELFLTGTLADPVFDSAARDGLPRAVAFVASRVAARHVRRADHDGKDF